MTQVAVGGLILAVVVSLCDENDSFLRVLSVFFVEEWLRARRYTYELVRRFANPSNFLSLIKMFRFRVEQLENKVSPYFALLYRRYCFAWK